MDILISGIGIAGPVAAYWLLKADPSYRITMVERDTQLRATGQSIDIRQAGVDVMKAMGLIAKIKAKTTPEIGIRFVDDNNTILAEFGASGNDEEQGFTSEYEIFRGDLVHLLYDTVKDRVKTVFDERVEAFEQDQATGKVNITFKNGKPNESYDLVIAADGQNSRIRNTALGTMDNPREHFRTFCNYAAYFTMKDIPSLNHGDMAAWYNTTKGRAFFIRPDTRPGLCRANIIRQLDPKDAEENKRYPDGLAAGMDAYRRLLKEDFADAGWAREAILKGLDETDDLYASESAQVQAPTTAVGRIAFVGDAGYCPTPLTGMGTSLAIIGAYVLAGEVSKEDHTGVERALVEYDHIMLPFSRSAQNIPLSVPQYLNPQSAWGLTAVRSLLRVVSWTKVYKLAGMMGGLVGPALGKKTFELPEYKWQVECS
jgi:2-polyprenyl-6-methoxyphenol hydroxylase-like FAD-dependent oxidoreductase